MEARADFILNFPFESIADHHRFRDSDGILYLLDIFHESTLDPLLQVMNRSTFINNFTCKGEFKDVVEVKRQRETARDQRGERDGEGESKD